MRERPQDTTTSLLICGITPAYAGKTNIIKVAAIASKDHPRVCGKDSARFSVIEIPSGSPPRMRERLVKKKKQMMVARITPAYAGKTSRAVC